MSSASGFRARSPAECVIEGGAGSSGFRRLPWTQYRCEAVFERTTWWLRRHGVEGEKPLHTLRKEAGSKIQAATTGSRACARSTRTPRTTWSWRSPFRRNATLLARKVLRLVRGAKSAHRSQSRAGSLLSSWLNTKSRPRKMVLHSRTRAHKDRSHSSLLHKPPSTRRTAPDKSPNPLSRMASMTLDFEYESPRQLQRQISGKALALAAIGRHGRGPRRGRR